jgi:hypothetical protein
MKNVHHHRFMNIDQRMFLDKIHHLMNSLLVDFNCMILTLTMNLTSSEVMSTN